MSECPVSSTADGRPRTPASQARLAGSQHPAVSHTLVLREVEALHRMDIEIESFSMRRAASTDPLSETSAQLTS
jgi:hypothetical protein